ncbi:MAG: DNA repair protein RecO [Chloroflexota bacterium]
MTERQAIPLNERLYRTEAIVLSRMDYGEADRILTLFTRRRGKVRVIAKSARKPLSRLGPHLEYFTRCRLLLARGRDLDVVSDAETIDAHPLLRSDLAALGHASHMAEVMDRLTEDRQEHEQAYHLLARSLRLLAEGVSPWLVARHYEWALLQMLGYRPSLYECVSCGNALLAEDNAWSSRLGGALCPLCHGAGSGVRRFPLPTQKVLRLLDREGLPAVARLEIPEGIWNDLEGLLGDYLRAVAERDFSSLRVWRAMEASAPYS